jgi:hypothetical protein
MASLVASFSMDKIGQLITLVGGGVKPPAKVKPAMAQRQGAGTTNTSTRNLQQNVVVNASGGITPQKAKSIGSSLANNARRGLVSAGVY